MQGAWPRAVSPATTDSPDTLTTQFVGRKRSVFWLALKTGIFTVLTLGLYRFWMKTRLRRYYWSAIRPGGLPLEYVGDPVEKLLGFLIAVVILAFYIGIVNLILMFLSFSLFQGNFAAYLASLIGVVPLWFYAQYRSRRYVLARTRWRGMRFGLMPGAWGYVGRALMYWALTILSAGLLLPLMTFRLEKYKTDRTFFGEARMHQGGRFTMLYRPFLPLLVAGLAGGASVALAAAAGTPEAEAQAAVAAPLAGLAALYGWVHYSVHSTALMARHKALNGVGLDLRPSAFKVTMITVFGYLVAALVIAVPAAVLLPVAVALANVDVLREFGGDDLAALASLPKPLLIGLGAVLYFSIFLLWGALTHAFVTLPTIRHYATRLKITASNRLADIRQRPRDEFTEAEGFAEALDVGASI